MIDVLKIYERHLAERVENDFRVRSAVTSWILVIPFCERGDWQFAAARAAKAMALTVIALLKADLSKFEDAWPKDRTPPKSG